MPKAMVKTFIVADMQIFLFTVALLSFKLFTNSVSIISRFWNFCIVASTVDFGLSADSAF